MYDFIAVIKISRIWTSDKIPLLSHYHNKGHIFLTPSRRRGTVLQMLSNGMNVALDDQEKTLSMLTVLAKLWICIPKDGSDTGGFDLIIFFFLSQMTGKTHWLVFNHCVCDNLPLQVTGELIASLDHNWAYTVIWFRKLPILVAVPVSEDICTVYLSLQFLWVFWVLDVREI